MSAYKTEQRRLTHQGREFHFVSYEGTRANPARGVEESPPMWCLMRAGKRWVVMPQQSDQPVEELEQQLHEWLDDHLAGRLEPIEVVAP